MSVFHRRMSYGSFVVSTQGTDDTRNRYECIYVPQTFSGFLRHSTLFGGFSKTPVYIHLCFSLYFPKEPGKDKIKSGRTEVLDILGGTQT